MFIKAIWFYHLEKRKQGEGVCLSIHLHPLSHIEKISDHSQVFVTVDKCIYIYIYSQMDDGIDQRKRVRSQIERDTSDIRTHTFKSQQNTYIHFSFVYQMMINDK